MALAILSTFTAGELSATVYAGDGNTLTQVPGVGKRTAERLAVELRTKLAGLSGGEPGLSLVESGGADSLPLAPAGLQELQSTLAALGYEDLEIRRAIRAVAAGATAESAASPGEAPSADDTDAWLRASLRWLSREPA